MTELDASDAPTEALPLAAALDACSDAIAIAGSADGGPATVRYANQRFAELVGSAAADLHGVVATDLFAPLGGGPDPRGLLDELAEGDAAALLLAAVGPKPVALGIRRLPGEERSVALVVRSHDDSGSPLQRAVDAVRAYLYSAELSPDDELLPLYNSAGIERILGGRVEPGTEEEHFRNGIHAEDRAAWLDSLRRYRAAAPGTTVEIEYRLIGVDGLARTIQDITVPRTEPDGRIILDGILIDVTEDRARTAALAEEHRRAAERLSAAEQAALTMERITSSVREYLYSGYVSPDNSETITFSGPGLEMLLGGPVPAGAAEQNALYVSRIDPADRHVYTEDGNYARLRTGRAIELEYRLHGLDGVVRWIRDTCVPRTVHDSDGTAAVELSEAGAVLMDGLLQDITVRREQIEALRAEQLRAADERSSYERIAQAVHEHLYSSVLRPDGSEFTTFMGPGLDQLVGGRLAGGIEAYDAEYLALVHPESRARFNPVAEYTRLCRGEPSISEYRLVGLDGVTRWVSERRVARAHRDERGGLVVDVGPDGAISVDGAITDITERRTMLEALEAARRLAEERHDTYERIADAVDTFLYSSIVYPDDSDHVVFDSPGLEDLIGGPAPPGDLDEVNAVFMSLLHPDDLSGYRAQFNHARFAAGEASDVEYRLCGLDGVTRWVRDRAVPRTRRLPDGSRGVELDPATGGVEIDGMLEDVTESRQIRDQLERAREEAERGRAALERIAEAVDEYLYSAIITPEQDEELLFQGPGLEQLIGGALPELQHDAAALFMSRILPEDYGVYMDPVVFERLAAGETVELEFRVLGLDGETRWVRDRCVPRTSAGADGTVVVERREDGAVWVDGIISDITEQKGMLSQLEVARAAAEQARSEAERQSLTDPLTGVANRRRATEAIERELSRAAREGGAPAVLLLDIDHFKRINDTYGHQVGDRVLEEVARRLGTRVRGYDLVARWGGEEFLVVLPGVTDEGSLYEVGEHLRRAVGERPIDIGGGQRLAATASVGAALAHTATWTVDALVDDADRGLYAAKRGGRDRTCVVDATLRAAPVDTEPEAVRVARALAVAATVREAVPASHPEDVATLAAAIARRLRLPADAVLRARLGGLLHDVGTIAVPAEVLLHPGPLGPEAWEQISRHPLDGAELVAPLTGIADAAPVVRHHHERWDGSGYPQGLAGHAIPIEARIVACADSWVTMRTDRPWRPALDEAAARAELERCAGSQLDAAVVEALVAELDAGG